MGEPRATNSLDRAFAILSAIGMRRGGMTNSELSRELGIPKSTCTYILKRLEREAYVLKVPATGRFKIGLRTLALAHDALREAGFYAIAEPALYRLAEATNLVAILGVLEGNRVLTVDRVESPEFMHDTAESGRSRWPYYPAKDQRNIGSELSLHASAIGRVILAYQPRDVMLKMVQGLTLKKFTPKTVVSKDELVAELERIREQGYAITDQQAHLDTLAIAAPIVDASGEVRAGVCVGGSRVLPTFNDMNKLIQMVKEAAREISSRMNQPHALRRELPQIVGRAAKPTPRNGTPKKHAAG